jgi:hypothetical protein
MLEGAKLHSEMEKEAFLRPMLNTLQRGYRSVVPMSRSKALDIDKLNTALSAQRRSQLAARMPSKLNPLSYGGLKGLAVTGVGGYAGLRGAINAKLISPETVQNAAKYIRSKGMSINPEYWALRNNNPFVAGREGVQRLGLGEGALRDAFVNPTAGSLDLTKRVNNAFWGDALSTTGGMKGFGEYASTLGTGAGSVAALPASLALKGLGAVAPTAATAIKGGLASLASVPYLGVAAPIGMSMAGIYGLKKAVGLGSKLVSRAGRARRLRMLRAGYAPSGYDPRLINYYGLR